MRSMQDGLSGFLKHVGLFNMIVRLYLEQKVLIAESSTTALKPPKSKGRSYLVKHKSVLLLNYAR